MNVLMIQTLLLVLIASASSFHVSFRRHSVSQLYSSTKGKGFGPPKQIPVDPTPPSDTKSSAESSGSTEITANAGSGASVVGPDADPIALIESTPRYKNIRERRNAELDEKIRKLKEEDDLIASDPSVGAVPEIVANRMIGRIVAFLGIPVFGGMLIFVLAFFASKKYDLTVPPMIIAYATQVPFILGLVGISYAILSSSWEETDGSALGIEEFKTNIKRIQDGFARTGDTSRLRDEIEKEKESLGRK